MQVSLLLAREIVELLLILLMGVAVVRTGLLRASDSKVVSVLLVYLVIPCVILNAFQIEDTPRCARGCSTRWASRRASTCSGWC